MRLLTTTLLSLCSLLVWAQRSAQVHAVEVLALPHNSGMTLQQAFQQAITNAQNRAIKDEFGTTVTSQTQMEIRKVGNANTSNLWNFVEMCAQGEWLADTRAPRIIDVSYKDATLFITAEVWVKRAKWPMPPLT